MDNSPNTKSGSVTPVIFGHFIIQKSAFFGLVKRLLTIKEDRIELNSLNFDLKHLETFNFADITIIQVSQESETQFVITFKKNNTVTLYCEARTQCLSEIYRAWDKDNIRKANYHPSMYPSYLGFKLITPGDKDTYIDTKIILYKTHLEMMHLSLVQSPKKAVTFEKIEGTENLINPTLSIPYYLIETLYKTHVGLVIEMKDSLARHEFIFYDMQKTNDLISRIQNNYKEHTGLFLDINDTMFDQGLTLETVVPKSYELFFFHTKALKILESGHLMPIKLALSDSYLVEIDIEEELVLQKYDLSSINNIVRMVTGLAGIQVTFEDFTVLTYIPPYNHKGLLASNLFTLANWKKNTQEYLIQNDFIHSMLPRYNLRVEGWINNETELDYEIELIRKFSRSQADENQFFDALHEFNLNARLKNYTSTDNSPLKLLIQMFNKNFKIIMTKEFISYWETYQIHISNRCKPEFENGSHLKKAFQHSQSLVYDDKSPSSKTPEDRIKNLLNKYQFEIAEKFPNIRFSTKTLPFLLYRTEELLKAIVLLISSRSLFKELAGNKREATQYENFIIDVARLLDSPYPTLSHLAGCFFRALTRFSDNSEQKAESINKSFLLGSRINLMQMVSALLAKRVLVKNQDQKEIENIYILSTSASLRILKSFVHERKDTTTPEDLQMILSFISKPYYFAIFNFLSRYRSIACMYNTTIILNSFFKNCTSRELYKSLQARFLNNSSLILLHIVLVLSSLSVLQRKISVILLSHLFYDNANACSLICRLFPKNLFRKVDFMSNDITQWTLQQWEQFFSLAVKDFNTTTEVWTEECREELLSKLKQMDDDINEKFNFCPSNRLQELFTDNSDEGEFLLNIRWNHEEYEIRYDFLQNKIPVGKYYLTTLLEDSEQPKLSTKIVNPAKLWSDLNMKFIGTKKVDDMAIILKTMILIYKDYNLVIRDLDTMRHWLRCLETKEYKRVWYLILQLLYVSVTVDDVSISRFNIKNFVDSDGISTLANVLSGLYFNEDHDILDEESYLNFQNNIREGMDYNYTNLNIHKHAYTPSLEKSCMISFIVNIYRGILLRYKDKKLNKQVKFVYPIPTGKSHILESSTLQTIINVLLLKDSDLTIDVLEFFIESLCDRFTYKILTEGTPIYEFLLYNMNLKTISHKCRLLYEIYCRILEERFGYEIPLRTYSSFTFKNISPETVEAAIAQFPILKYLPKHFIWKITRNEIKDIGEIFFSEAYETPQLIWNSEMRESLANGIELHLQKFIYELVRFSESQEIHDRTNLPQYTIGTFDIVYDNLEEEVYCGPMFLRVWISKSFSDFKIPNEEVPIFLEKLNLLLRKYLTEPLAEASPKHFNDLLIVLKAHSKAIKVYSLTKYDCFGEVLTILKFLPEKISHWHPVEGSEDQPLDIAEYILTLCRLIYRTIRIENSENATVFARTKGIEVFLLILDSLVHRINVAKNMENYNYYADMQISYEDLKILDLIIRIIVKMLQKCYSELAALDHDVKLKLFMNLLTVSKIPLILFEHVRNINIRSKSGKLEEEKSSLGKNKITPFDKVEEEPENEDEVIEVYSPESTSVFDLITSQPESSEADVCIMKIFIISKNLLDLLAECSIDAPFINTFVQSGLVWRFLEFLTYYNDIGEVSASNNNPNYQTMLINIEKICNIVRNLVMYGNEAFVWKIAGASNESSVDIIVASQEHQSSEVSRILTKIDSSEKLLLCQFFECVMQLLGKRLTQVLMSNYTQPRVAPKEKDILSINKFLKYFSTELSEPTDLWNEETRNELKSLLIEQIMTIYKSSGGDYLNLIENFKYKLHGRNLLIGDIFVSQYNKIPDWKLEDPARFIHEALRAIEVFRTSLMTHQPPTAFIGNEADEACLLDNIEEALTGILNAIMHSDTNSILLNEQYLTQLGSLLNDPELEKLQTPKTTNFKSRVLGIAVHLSKLPNEAQKLVANVTLMRNIFKVLRGNTKESMNLFPKILFFLENASVDSICRKALFNFGFYIALLESILKVEIHQIKYRSIAFELLVKVLRALEPSNPLLHRITQLFPLHIQQKIFNENNLHEVVEALDKGYDTPRAMWTKLMRQEVLLILDKECFNIQEQWDKCHQNEIDLSHPTIMWDTKQEKEIPAFPEIEESLRIDDIFLNNFNKMPLADKNINLVVFADNIATYIHNLFNTLVDQAKKCQEAETNFKTLDEEEVQSFKNITSKFITLLTSLLLTTDQLFSEIKSKEEVIPQKEEIHEEGEHDEMKEVSPEEEDDNSTVHHEAFLSENILSCIIKCTELFSTPMIHSHILSLELQLIFLIAESQRGLVVLKDHNIILFLTDLLRKITETQPEESPFHHVEEKLVLCILLRMLLKDSASVSDTIDEGLEPLRKILVGNKSYLNHYIYQIMALLSRHPEKGKEAFVQINKGRALITLAIIHDCTPGTFLNQVWRSCSKGWNPFSANNTLNVLYQEDPEDVIEYPVVSDYAILCFLHPQKKNADVQKTINEYIDKITDQHANSLDVKLPIETKMSPQRHY